MFLKSSILVQLALCISNNFLSYILKDFNLLFLSSTLKFLTYPVILDIIKANGLVALSEYQIKYLELVFVLTSFEITVLSTLTSQIFIGSFAADTSIFLKISYSSSDFLSLFRTDLMSLITLSKVKIFSIGNK